MKTPRWIVALFVLSSFAAVTRGTVSAVPFRDLSFADASKAAATEGKLVFIDFYTTWCGPCKMLDEQTWTDAKVGQLVGEKAVALKLDAEKEGLAAAKRYKIAAYPTLLLLKADGTEVDRIVGFREPAKFIAEFTAAVNGKPSLARATEAVSTAANDRDAVKARYDLARELMRQGRLADALAEYLWCFDVGMVQVSSYSGVRLSFLLGDLERMAKTYIPAREAMEARCSEAEKRLLADPSDRNAGAEFAALCSHLGEDSRLLALFDQFPAGDKRRAALGHRAYKLLREKHRYADALEAVPYRVMAMPFDMNTRRPPQADARMEEANRRYVIGSGLDSIEVLAGAGDLDHAREMIDKLVAFDSTDDTKKQIAKRLAQAGKPELFKIE
jgi:thiol-disulfide isomerase/thioredoxin